MPDDLGLQLQAIFRLVFDEPDLVLRPEMTAADVPGWDSLAHINLIVAVERTMKVRFATAEISKLKEPGENVGSLQRLIANKLAQRRKGT